MGKGDYKKISSGPIWLKADLDVRHFLGMKQKTKRWMKNALNRYERRRGKEEDIWQEQRKSNTPCFCAESDGVGVVPDMEIF